MEGQPQPLRVVFAGVYDLLDSLVQPRVPLDRLRKNSRLPTSAERSETVHRLEFAKGILRAHETFLRANKSHEDLAEVLTPDRLIQHLGLLKREEHLRSWVAPVRRIPAEVLELVFYHVCREDNPAGYALFIGDQGSGVCMGPALGLGTVCHRWHEVAHSSPRLWNSISINISSLVVPRHRAILEFYLARSTHLPLERLAILEDHEELPEDVAELVSWETEPFGTEEVLSTPEISLWFTLIERMDQARELHLRVTHIPLEYSQVSSLAFPNLVSFINESYADGASNGTSTQSTLLRLVGHAPNLRSVHIATPMFCISSTTLAFESLTSLTVNYIGVDELGEILPRLRKLQKLQVLYLEEGAWPPTANHPVTIPSLSSFHVSLLSYDSLAEIFSSLVLPSLTDLVIASFFNGRVVVKVSETIPPVWASSLRAMLERSKYPLLYLMMDFPYTPNMPASTIPDFLLSCPEIRDLDIRIIGRALSTQKSPLFTAELLKQLVPESSTPADILSPRLTSLFFREPLSVAVDQTKEDLARLGVPRSRRVLQKSGLGDVVSPLENVVLEFVNAANGVLRCSRHVGRDGLNWDWKEETVKGATRSA
ncbi:hypothetical protein AAF712_005685 [Marasmius tenuissimus]|uniref:F-box domain-containing protein n=1 Tax=Marasmius tenuissimus TaxID=585030 RepID=A0ABR3A402_9AGAR